MLIKYNYTSNQQYLNDIQNPKFKLHPILETYIQNNYKQLKNNTIIYTNTYSIITTFTNDIINNIINDKVPRIPIYLNIKIDNNTFKNINIYKSINSFEQNNLNLSNLIRQNVISNLIKSSTSRNIHTSNSNILLGIGGEYYLYQCLISQFNFYSKYIGITNNTYINQDATYNYNLYISRSSKSYLIDSYNNIDKSNFYNDFNKLIVNNNDFDIIINLAKLNINVIKFMEKYYQNINNLIIISCKKKDFINKYKRFTKFEIVKFNTFYDNIMNQEVNIYYLH